MWRGRYQLGQEAVIGLVTTNANGSPSVPDRCPNAQVWDDSGTLVWNGQIPTLDRYGTTGLFQYRLFLTPPFATGLYRVTYEYTVGNYTGVETDTFEVVAGGSSVGAVRSLEWYHRPHGEFVIQQTESGGIQKGRNPRV